MFFEKSMRRYGDKTFDKGIWDKDAWHEMTDIWNKFEKLTSMEDSLNSMLNNTRFNEDEEGNGVLKIALPGVSREKIKIEATERKISIKVDTKSQPLFEYKTQYSYTVSKHEPRKATSTFVDGVLTITMPKRQKTTPVAPVTLKIS